MTNLNSLPRGIRNNNPGNILDNIHYQWVGQSGADGEGYCTFTTAQHGLRAALVLLHNYQLLYELKTVNQLIRRWAPPGANDTADYIRFIAGRLHVLPDSRVSVMADWLPLLRGITAYENGMDPYSDSIYMEAYTMTIHQR